jgi:hypothetical protein
MSNHQPIRQPMDTLGHCEVRPFALAGSMLSATHRYGTDPAHPAPAGPGALARSLWDRALWRLGFRWSLAPARSPTRSSPRSNGCRRSRRLSGRANPGPPTAHRRCRRLGVPPREQPDHRRSPRHRRRLRHPGDVGQGFRRWTSAYTSSRAAAHHCGSGLGAPSCISVLEVPRTGAG